MEVEGMEVSCVGSAEEALELTHKGGVMDVCIMDLHLPGMDGAAAIRTLHRIQPAMRYIFHTARVGLGYTVPDDLHVMSTDEEHLFTKPLRNSAPQADTIRNLRQRANPAGKV